MIKLNTRDIVKRATQLADLENSSFISWNENIQILNESFQKIYQKIINHDDKTYLVKVPLGLPMAYGDGETHYELPDDFYQLYALNDSRSGKCVLRRSLNDPVNTFSYDIINNELVIYGHSNMSLILSYFPVPKTLTLKADAVKIDMPENISAFSDCLDKKIVWLTGTKADGYKLHVHDIDSQITTENGVEAAYSSGNEDFVGLIATKAGIVLHESHEYWSLYSFTGDYIMQKSGPLFLDNHKNLYTIKQTASNDFFVSKIVNGVEVTLKDITGSGILSEFYGGAIPHFRAGVGSIDAETFSKGYFVRTANTRSDPVTSDTYSFDFINDDFKVSGKLMSDDFGYIIGDFVFQAWTLRDVEGNYIQSGVAGVNKIDEETGYGYTTLDGQIVGVFYDTEINYPNNMFISLIAYLMAIQYKSKQNAECSGLVALYQQAEEQFFDSIGRDDYQYTRIQNVY